MRTFQLPDAVVTFCKAHAVLQAHFKSTGLRFTLDGRLVGDIAEALAADWFDLDLCKQRTRGVDAHTKHGRSVQIKSTGDEKRGPAFTPGDGIADHLLFLRINFGEGTVNIAYNGPEAPIREFLPSAIRGTATIPLSKILAADARVPPQHRLPVRQSM